MRCWKRAKRRLRPLRFWNYQDEKLAGLDHVAGLGIHFLDRARDLGRQHVLHLHRFDDEQRIAWIDLASGLDVHLQNLPRHRSTRLGIAVCTPRARSSLAAEIELEALAADGHTHAASRT